MSKWLPDVKETVACTLAHLDMLDLVDRLKVSFNGRFTNRAGDADYSQMRVRFSTPLWYRMTEQERYEVVVHEVCHIAVGYRHNKKILFVGLGSHGPAWQAIMRECGVKPERCHNIDTRGLKRKRKPVERYPVPCDCRTHFVTLIKINRMKLGWRYFCRYCKCIIRPERD